MDSLYCQAEGMYEELRTVRRTLHQHPEIGFDLSATTALIEERLQSMGISFQRCGGGLVAEIGDPTGSKTVLLRADMDALPLQEQSGLDFAATGQACHACGHDIHTAMLVGAARLLKAQESQMKGMAMLMFQPAEETAQGARAMLDAGLFSRKPDAAFGIHVAPFSEAGCINVTSGNKTASYDCFDAMFIGKGGHGAQPQNAVDPINAAIHAYIALQACISGECDPAEPAVLTVGSFHAGSAGNILSDTAVMQGTIRTATAKWRDFLRRRLEEICEGTAATLRAQAQIAWQAQVPPLYNDPNLASQTLGWLLEAGLDANGQAEWLSASDDFALVAEQVPTVFMTIGSGTPEKGYLYGNHHPAVMYDEAILPSGATALAACAIRFLNG